MRLLSLNTDLMGKRKFQDFDCLYLKKRLSGYEEQSSSFYKKWIKEKFSLEEQSKEPYSDSIINYKDIYNKKQLNQKLDSSFNFLNTDYDQTIISIVRITNFKSILFNIQYLLNLIFYNIGNNLIFLFSSDAYVLIVVLTQQFGN